MSRITIKNKDQIIQDVLLDRGLRVILLQVNYAKRWIIKKMADHGKVNSMGSIRDLQI